MRQTILFFLLCFSILMTSCSKGPEQEFLAGEALGTSFQIRYYSDEPFLLEQGLDSIFDRVNQSMSTYREDSDISRLNRGDSVKVDSLFQKVFQLSQQVYVESGGSFDPTVGTLVNYYGFGPETGSVTVDTTEVDSLMQFVGLNKVRIESDGVVLKTDSRIYLDFNAIAKGYTIDLIGHYLDQQGVNNYLVELGGELLARGENLNKTAPWTVGVDDPRQEEGERTLIGALQLHNRAMATSGNYRKNRLDPVTGKMFVHTIDPLTGYARKSDVLSASVLAANCALADAYATAFMAMGLERTKEVLPELENVDAFLIYAKENGESGEFMTEGFEKVMVDL